MQQLAVACTNCTVKRSKIRHIDARQDWAMRNSSIRKPWKVDTNENESDLLAKTRELGRSVRTAAQSLHGVPGDPDGQGDS